MAVGQGEEFGLFACKKYAACEFGDRGENCRTKGTTELDTPELSCDLTKSATLRHEPDNEPKPPTMALFFARLADWRLTSKKLAKVARAPVATGALKSWNVSGAPDTLW